METIILSIICLLKRNRANANYRMTVAICAIRLNEKGPIYHLCTPSHLMHSSALNDSVFSKIGRQVRRPPTWLLFMSFHYSNINYLN